MTNTDRDPTFLEICRRPLLSQPDLTEVERQLLTRFLLQNRDEFHAVSHLMTGFEYTPDMKFDTLLKAMATCDNQEIPFTYEAISALPRQGPNLCGFSLEKLHSWGIGEAECEAFSSDSTLRDVVRLWSTLDPAIKQAITAIIQSQSRD